MSVANVALKDTVLSAGMNEGIDVTVLPPEQLAYMQNARIRKPGRVGKRNGYLKLPLTLSGQIRNTVGTAPFGTSLLSGNICGAGDRLVVVQDKAYGYSDQKAVWYDQFAAGAWSGQGSGIVTGAANQRAFVGHVAGWRPVRATYPGYQEDTRAVSLVSFDSEYFNGLHWTCCEQLSPSGGTSTIQVNALDPVTDRVVWTYEFTGSQPRLVNLGATLCLLYVDSSGTVIRATQFVNFGAAFMGGLSAGLLVLEFASGTITGGSGYHAIPFSATQILLVYQSAAPTITLKLLNVAATGISAGTTTNYNPAAAGPYFATVASDTGNSVTLAWKAADGRVYARLFTTAIVASGAEITMSTGTSNVYRPSVTYSGAGGSPVVAWHQTGYQIAHAFISGGASTHRLFVSPRFQMVSSIFYVGARLYCWAIADGDSSLQRYLCLLNLDDPTAGLFPAAGPDVSYVPGIELTIQDALASYAQDVTSNQLWLGKCVLGLNGYLFAAPFVRSTPGTADNLALRLVQANHYSETVRRRSIDVQPARGAQVMAGGVVSAFYSTGAYEVGFLFAPGVLPLTAGAGGGMTAGVTYFYCAVWRWVNANGETELSAPSAVSSVAMGANTKVTVTISGSQYALGPKSGVALDIYRSVSGSVFNYVGTAQQTGSLTYVDTATDATVQANGAIYTQVGQELENRPPPACRFSCVSQNRLWLGGLADPRVIHSSKAFLKGIATSFADDDAFRVVLPDDCTGLAFLDSMVAFTRSAIYVIGGDGPDNSGANGWVSPVSLPFQLGCIDWRSVIVSEEGIFFQSDRGLYMLPRGFGEPIPAGDAVMDQLRTYSICTGAAAVTRGDMPLAQGSSAESTIRWGFCQEETCAHGILVVYDRVHKAWSVDVLTNPGANQNGPAFLSTWQDGANALTVGSGAPGGRMFFATDNTTPQFSGGGFANALLRESTPGEYANAGFGDVQTALSDGGAYQMTLRTPQIRPFGLFGHGIVSRLGALGYVQNATTLNVNKTTDLGTGSTSLAVTGAGAYSFWECALGSQEGRDVNNLQLEFATSDKTEGVLFSGFAIEVGEPQGFKKLPAAQRST